MDQTDPNFYSCGGWGYDEDELTDLFGRHYIGKCDMLIYGASVLDVGCGDGFFSSEFSRFGAQVVLGIDISEDAINVARQKRSKPNVRGTFPSFRVDDYHNVQGQYDIVFVRGLWEAWLVEPLVPWVKPDGLLIISRHTSGSGIAEPGLFGEPMHQVKVSEMVMGVEPWMRCVGVAVTGHEVSVLARHWDTA